VVVPGLGNDPTGTRLPEKFLIRHKPHAVGEPEEGEIPHIIRKFLIQRKTGPEKIPEPAGLACPGCAGSRAGGFLYVPDDRVVGFVAGQFPDRAPAIRKGNVEQHVAEAGRNPMRQQ